MKPRIGKDCHGAWYVAFSCGEQCRMSMHSDFAHAVWKFGWLTHRGLIK